MASDEAIQQRLIATLNATADDETTSIAIPRSEFPAEFNPAEWAMRNLLPIGRAIVAALADRPAVRLVNVIVPGLPVPVGFPVTPKN